MINRYDLETEGEISLSEHFQVREFASRYTNEILISETLIDLLEKLYSALNCDSMIINSGYRCDQDVEAGIGNYGDPHQRGIAADIYCYKDGIIMSGASLCCSAQDCGFNGIGYMGNAIHVDSRGYDDHNNDHWWGDENNDCNVSDWYDYFGIERPSEEEPEDSDDVSEDPDPIEEGHPDGWYYEDGNWKYSKDGNDLTNSWINTKNKWYYLNEYGEMTTNDWIKNSSGTWSYVNDDGEAYTNGWHKISEKWYYFDSDGVMYSDRWIHNDSDTWSYVSKDGDAVVGWKELVWDNNTDYYYFDSDGVMLINTWKDDYFVCNTGKMMKSIWIGHDNTYYWVGDDGLWLDKPSWKHEGYPNDGYPVYEY